MTDPYETVALGLADEFGLEVDLIVRAKAFRMPVRNALVIMSAEHIVEEIIEAGSLTGAENPYGVLFTRIRDLAGRIEEPVRIEGNHQHAAELDAAGRAARRGEIVRGIVAENGWNVDEGVEILHSEFNDPELLGLAIDAFHAQASSKPIPLVRPRAHHLRSR